jgi:putative transposase
MGLSGISKSTVSKLCKGEASRRAFWWKARLPNDERVHDFLDRPLAGEWPYLWLDATNLKVCQGGVRAPPEPVAGAPEPSRSRP